MGSSDDASCDGRGGVGSERGCFARCLEVSWPRGAASQDDIDTALEKAKPRRRTRRNRTRTGKRNKPLVSNELCAVLRSGGIHGDDEDGMPTHPPPAIASSRDVRCSRDTEPWLDEDRARANGPERQPCAVEGVRAEGRHLTNPI